MAKNNIYGATHTVFVPCPKSASFTFNLVSVKFDVQVINWVSQHDSDGGQEN